MEKLCAKNSQLKPGKQLPEVPKGLSFILGIILVIVSIGVVFLLRQSKQQATFDTTYALLGDIVEFAKVNDKTLPRNWDQFIVWYNHTHAKPRWKMDQLQSDFELQWGLRSTEILETQSILKVHDPFLRKNEAELNKALRRWLLSLSSKRHE